MTNRPSDAPIGPRNKGGDGDRIRLDSFSYVPNQHEGAKLRWKAVPEATAEYWQRCPALVRMERREKWRHMEMKGQLVKMRSV